MPLKILRQEKIMQTSRANSEHKHSEIERFLTLNECIITFCLQHQSSIYFGFKIKRLHH